MREVKEVAERCIDDLTGRRQQRYKELEANRALTPVKLAILGIEESVNTVGWGSFFTIQHKDYRKEIPITKLCSTNLVGLFEAEAKKAKYAQTKFIKSYNRLEISLQLGDIKAVKKERKRLAAMSLETFSSMDAYRKPILDYFNDIHRLFKLLYAFKNNIPIREAGDIQLNMLKLMQETRVIRFYDLKTPFYDFNDLRNLVAHNNIEAIITEKEWLAFASTIKSIDDSIKEVIRNYFAPLKKAQGILVDLY